MKKFSFWKTINLFHCAPLCTSPLHDASGTPLIIWYFRQKTLIILYFRQKNTDYLIISAKTMQNIWVHNMIKYYWHYCSARLYFNVKVCPKVSYNFKGWIYQMRFVFRLNGIFQGWASAWAERSIKVSNLRKVSQNHIKWIMEKPSKMFQMDFPPKS